MTSAYHESIEGFAHCALYKSTYTIQMRAQMRPNGCRQ